jgi:predicted DNA-binding transcriptional regulator
MDNSSASSQANLIHPGQIASKWGDAVSLGFLAIPDALLINQANLKLTTTETMVLLNVLSYWWFAERKPFPRTSVIARRMGVSNRTVQRALEQLQKKGALIKAENSRGAVIYDPTPLVAMVQQFARRDPRFLTKGGN